MVLFRRCVRLVVCKRRKVTLLVLILVSVLMIWSQLYGYGNRVQISVFVIEEHHEALQYWVETGNMGQIPKKGNTLVHIDGHSDDNLPRYLSGMPFFHWPWTDLEVDLMLQQNDVFINEAISVGLIDRFLWIVPEWNNDTREVELEVTEMELGWADVRMTGDEEEITVFCLCEYNDTQTPKIHNEKQCYYLNTSFESPGDPKIYIHPLELCEIQRRYTYEIMPVKVALERLKDGDLFEENEPLILDIDEDYFGCEIPGRRLYDVNLTWSMFQNINDNLSMVFCPKLITHESQASMLMSYFLDTLIRLCKYTEALLPEQRCIASVQFILSQIYSNFLESWKNDPQLFCARTDLELKESLKKLVSSFSKLQPRQIIAIQTIGFCLNTSPKTIWFDDQGQFVLCHGNNDPDRPMVQVYVPETGNELNSSLVLVNEFLHKVPTPGVVTLCRSVRDGYTPRNIFKTVEQNLLSFFKSQIELSGSEKSIESNVFPHEGKNMDLQSRYKIVYDNFLLNGSYGLHRKWV